MSTLISIIGIIAFGAACLANEIKPLSEADQQKILSRLEHPLIADCQKYYEFDAFLQVLLVGNLPKETESDPASLSPMKQQFIDYVKSGELKSRSSENVPENLSVGCNSIARGITEAQLMKAQLVTGAAAAIGEGIAKAFEEFGKSFGDAINEGLKSTLPAK
ncbi:MAG: hypothetical protein ACXVA9_07160 [Bdellovibrionales bacterium]